MFLLMHAYIAEQLVGHMTEVQRDQLLIGSILPDVSELQIADEIPTHTEGKQFLDFVGKDFRHLGLGFILHGHKPNGLDYHTHRGFYELGRRYVKPTPHSGVIGTHYLAVEPILRKYKKSLGKTSINDAAHFMIEFCFDHIVAQRDPTLGKRLRKAMKRSTKNGCLLHFANYFKLHKHQLLKLKVVMKSPHWPRVFRNFRTVHGTAHNLQNFLFVKKLADKSRKKKRGKFMNFVAKIGMSSLGFLQTKMYDRALAQMFERCLLVVKKDHEEFIDRTLKQMKIMMKKENFGRI